LANTCGPKPIISPYGPRRSVTTWKVNYIVANRANIAAHGDPDLLNPWGIVIFNNQLWVATNNTDTVNNYDLFGNKILATATIRDTSHNSAYPTGIVVNCGGGFTFNNNINTQFVQFFIVTEHGTIHGYNPALDPINTYVLINQQLNGITAVFRGAAIANNLLYAPDFLNRQFYVFDNQYNRLTGFFFIDTDTTDPIPLDFGPSNIVLIGCYLYVVWAKQDPVIVIQGVPGPGFGFISIFNFDGSFVRRFTSRGVLNNPWGLIPAPCECGFPPGSFLVSNRGDGRINIFDCNGRYVGPLLGQSGLPISFDGITGLAPHYADFSEIFFTASANEMTEGLIGSFVKDQVIYF